MMTCKDTNEIVFRHTVFLPSVVLCCSHSIPATAVTTTASTCMSNEEFPFRKCQEMPIGLGLATIARITYVGGGCKFDKYT